MTMIRGETTNEGKFNGVLEMYRKDLIQNAK